MLEKNGKHNKITTKHAHLQKKQNTVHRFQLSIENRAKPISNAKYCFHVPFTRIVIEHIFRSGPSAMFPLFCHIFSDLRPVVWFVTYSS